MNKQYEVDYVLNEFGDIDVNYYINKGRQLRAQALRDESQKLSNAIKGAISNLAGSLFNPKPA
ncbi:MAG: hypothetical protein ACRBCI_01445 [Cellvibrionaceae bacterium]